MLSGKLAQMRHRALNPIRQWVRRQTAPRMIWGYIDSDGSWRPRTRISSTAILQTPENIHIADNVFVWHYTILDGTGGLFVGDGAQIGAWVGIFTHSSHVAIRLLGDHYQEANAEELPAYHRHPTRIGRYVFIGAGATILPGVTIGDGALISAGAVISKSVAPFAIAAGNPAKIVGDVRRLDKMHLNDPKIRAWYDEWTCKSALPEQQADN